MIRFKVFTLILCSIWIWLPLYGEDTAISKDFKHLVFSDDFEVPNQSGPPLGWTVLKSQMHDQCRVEDHAYHILFGKNTHCPTPLKLKDFAIEFDVHGYRDTSMMCMFFDFRVRPDRSFDREGWSI